MFLESLNRKAQSVSVVLERKFSERSLIRHTICKSTSINSSK